MSNRTALIFYGGWEGHTPRAMAELLGRGLEARGIAPTLAGTLSVLEDAERLRAFDLIVPVWTMGEMREPMWRALDSAVREHGVGIGGPHGGVSDAFRGHVEYEWMIGGHFVGHPYVGPYKVRVIDRDHPATADLPGVFEYDSEQYYMLVDPGARVLARTIYHTDEGEVEMPVAWHKRWGDGRVFYSALGHTAEELEAHEVALKMTIEGLVWAARDAAE